jgi:POT family proton-dependent oligopeptide transporter
MAELESVTHDRSFFGHPKGLAYLLGAEAGWAFAYYGLQAMLTLYMTSALLKPGHAEHVWALGAYRTFMQGLYGPLSDTGLASQTFGLATGMIYALPFIGGFIADRWLGQRRAVMLGLAIITIGHVLLIGEPTFLIALVLMVIGAGFLKTCLVGQIGRLYPLGDDRRARGFGLYLIAVNTGSFITPLISGTLGERVGWGYGFGAMAVGVGLGAVCYLVGRRHMPPDILQVRVPGALKAPRLKRGDGRIVAVLILLIFFDKFFFSGTYNQAFNIFPVWAENHVERHILGFLTPVTWFSTLDGVLTIVGTVVAVRVWSWQSKRAGNLSDIHRIAVGFALIMGAFLLMTLGAVLARTAKAPIAPEIGFFLLADFSIPWIETIVLTMISRDAPAAINTTMLGFYYVVTAAGNVLVGWLGALSDHMSMVSFWLMHGAITGVVLVFLIVAGSSLSRFMAPQQSAEA